MYTVEDIEKYKEELFKLGNEMHPHLGDDNHTNRLMRSLFNNEQLSPRDYFDLGKYYQRMLDMIRPILDADQLSAVLYLKHQIR